MLSKKLLDKLREDKKTKDLQYAKRMNEKLIISIDYDNTFTADTKGWAAVIAILREFGHTVICVSARENTERNREQIEGDLPNTVVLLTTSQPKAEFARKSGYEISIWIDDCPQAIPSREECLCYHGNP